MSERKEIYFFRQLRNWMLIFLSFLLFCIGFYLIIQLHLPQNSLMEEISFAILQLICPLPILIALLVQSQKCKLLDPKRCQRYRIFSAVTILFMFSGMLSLCIE